MAYVLIMSARDSRYNLNQIVSAYGYAKRVTKYCNTC